MQVQLPRHTDWAQVATRAHMLLSQSLSDDALDELLADQTQTELVFFVRAA
jgi:hypothetical protein